MTITREAYLDLMTPEQQDEMALFLEAASEQDRAEIAKAIDERRKSIKKFEKVGKEFKQPEVQGPPRPPVGPAAMAEQRLKQMAAFAGAFTEPSARLLQRDLNPQLQQTMAAFPKTSFAGEMAGYVPPFSAIAATLPATLPLWLSGAATFGGYELLAKPKKGESRLGNAAFGAVIGGVLPPVFKVVGKAGVKIGDKIINSRIVKKAINAYLKRSLNRKELKEANKWARDFLRRDVVKGEGMPGPPAAVKKVLQKAKPEDLGVKAIPEPKAITPATKITKIAETYKGKKKLLFENKDKLLAEIDTQLKRAPETQGKEPKYITFEYDGEAKIEFVKPQLEQFKQVVSRVGKFVPTRQKPKGIERKEYPVWRKKEEMKPLLRIEGKGAEKYFTDGIVIIKGKSWGKKTPGFNEERLPVQVAKLEEFLQTPTKPVSFKHYYLRGTGEEPIAKGVSEYAIPSKEAQVYFKGEGGEAVANQLKFKVIQNRYPGATWGLDKSKTMLIAYDKGKPVGVLMTMRVKEGMTIAEQAFATKAVPPKPKQPTLKALQAEYASLAEKEVAHQLPAAGRNRMTELSGEITKRFEINPNREELSAGLGLVPENLQQKASRLMKQAEAKRKAGGDIPNIVIEDRPKDIGISQWIGTPLNQWKKFGKTPQKFSEDINLTMDKVHRDITRYNDEIESMFRELPRGFRKEKGRKFIEIIDKNTTKEIERMSKLDPKVKETALKYKKFAESRRQEIIKVKREGAKNYYNSLTNRELLPFIKSLPDVSTKEVGGKLFFRVGGEKSNKGEVAKMLSELDYSDTWGRPERWFPHVFLGRYRMTAQVAGENVFIGRATDPTEALRKVAAFHANRPEIPAEAYNIKYDFFFQPDMVRLTDRRFWGLVGQMKNELNIGRKDIADAFRGKIGRKTGKQKFWGSLLQRTGQKGFLEDFRRAMEVNNFGFVRWKELTALNKRLQPMIDQMRLSGQTNLARDADDLLEIAWGRGSKSSMALDASLQGFSRATGYRMVFKPQLLERVFGKVKSMMAFMHLETPRFAMLQQSQLFQTLWPTVKTGEFIRGVRWMRTKEAKAVLERYGASRSAIRWAQTGIIGIKPSRWRISTFTEKINQERAFSILYKKGIDMGMADAQAARYARLRGQFFTQFLHSPTDQPKILRGPVMSTIFQYKRFPIKNIEIGLELLRSRDFPGVSKWLTAQLVLGGLRVVTKPAVLLGLSAYKLHKMYEDVEKEYGTTTRNLVEFGLPSLVGLDYSGSINMLDIPWGSNLKERIGTLMMGPAGQTGYWLFKDIKGNPKRLQEEGVYTRLKRSSERRLPFVKQIIALERLLADDKNYRDIKGRKRFNGELSDILADLGSFRRLKRSKERDLMDAVYNVTKERSSVIDESVRFLASGKAADGIKKALEWNEMFPEFPIMGKDIESRLKRRITDAELSDVERTLRRAPKAVEIPFRIQELQKEVK